MPFYYFIIFFIAFSFSFIFTLFFRKIALKINVVDEPRELRKIHNKKIPLLGGAAIFLSFFIALSFVKDKILSGELRRRDTVVIDANAEVLAEKGEIL